MFMPTRKLRLGPADRRRMEELTTSAPTKSAKIRVLAAAGYARQQIADFLGIRYQHVRNVLVQKESYAPGRGEVSGMTVAERAAATTLATDPPGTLPPSRTLVVDALGRVTLPPELLAALDAQPGHPLPWRLEEGELRLMSLDAGLRIAREILKPYLDRISVAGFLDERRQEARSEEGDDPP
jgi:bifunctional DNA-binding transcriptional regulator/antitoxin component of YhaV-PrlF toxin-antitoxin module